MADYGNCINWVLRLEDRTLAGNTVNLGDGAGYTRFGITSKNNPQVDPTFWFDTPTLQPGIHNSRMPNDEALEVAKDIYWEKYWSPIWGSVINSNELAATLLSFAVNDGVVTAVRLLQRVLGVAVDGAMGRISLAAANTTVNAAELLREKQEAYYLAIVAIKPDKKKFLNGWLSRCRAVYPDLPA